MSGARIVRIAGAGKPIAATTRSRPQIAVVAGSP
jgi:hypothetical protein